MLKTKVWKLVERVFSHHNKHDRACFSTGGTFFDLLFAHISCDPKAANKILFLMPECGNEKSNNILTPFDSFFIKIIGTVL